MDPHVGEAQERVVSDLGVESQIVTLVSGTQEGVTVDPGVESDMDSQICGPMIESESPESPGRRYPKRSHRLPQRYR